MKWLILLTYLAVLAARHGLRWLNLRHLARHGATVPEGFEDAVRPEDLQKTSAYTLARSRLGLLQGLLGSALLVLFLFGGLLPHYDRWAASSGGFVLSGTLFLLGLLLIQTALDIPFSLYGTFCIEARFGFNTTTWRLWLSDLLKSTLLSLLLAGLLAAGALALVSASPDRWWLWVWALFAAVTLFLLYLSPVLIEPLFFRFEPVRREGLEEEIRRLMGRAGLKVSKVLQVDASRRSRHSNAYFTGIGRVKRIVLFDTLLEQMEPPETLAILAHEVGHWKKGHIWKRLLATEALFLAGCYVAFRLLHWPGLPELLGLEQASFCARLVLVAFLGSLAAFPLAPLSSWLSRRAEWQADRYAAELTGEPEHLASALVRLSRENLANLHPHPLYARVYYSHPPIV